MTKLISGPAGIGTARIAGVKLPKGPRQQILASESEASFQDRIIELAHLCHWRVAHFRPAKTEKGWRTAVSADGAGFPDLVLVSKKKGIIIFWECKREGEPCSPAQREWIEDLTAVSMKTHRVIVGVVQPSDWELIEEVLK